MNHHDPDPFDRILRLLGADADAAAEVTPDDATNDADLDSTPGDAIDRILARPPRRTDARSLRTDPAIVAFRRELQDGIVRADTVRRVLQLISAALEARIP